MIVLLFTFIVGEMIFVIHLLAEMKKLKIVLLKAFLVISAGSKALFCKE